MTRNVSDPPEFPAPGIDGAGNFRSLAGLVAHDGRRIRPHFLMRSDRLCHLTAEGWQQLTATGLVTICDLRSREECALHPNAVPAELGLTEVSCEVRNELRGNRSLLETLVEQPTAEGAEAVMCEVYRRLPQEMAPALNLIFGRLLEGGAPMLIHCTAGKDRTGFAVAMVLHALGVSHDEIERDYMLSNGWLHARIHRASLAKGLAVTLPAHAVDAVLDPMLSVSESYLRASMERIANEFGSPDRYLEAALNLDASKRERLRELLLT